MIEGIAFTRFVTDMQIQDVVLAFKTKPKLKSVKDITGQVLAYRVGEFDAFTIEGVKDFTPELVAKRKATCKGCEAFDFYEYQGKTLTMCTEARKPNCHNCHSRIINNLEPCPRGILPVE